MGKVLKRTNLDDLVGRPEGYHKLFYSELLSEPNFDGLNYGDYIDVLLRNKETGIVEQINAKITDIKHYPGLGNWHLKCLVNYGEQYADLVIDINRKFPQCDNFFIYERPKPL